jgi:hypothetical protein
MVSMRRTITSSFISISHCSFCGCPDSHDACHIVIGEVTGINNEKRLTNRLKVCYTISHTCTNGLIRRGKEGATPIVVGEKQHLWRAR